MFLSAAKPSGAGAAAGWWPAPPCLLLLATTLLAAPLLAAPLLSHGVLSAVPARCPLARAAAAATAPVVLEFASKRLWLAAAFCASLAIFAAIAGSRCRRENSASVRPVSRPPCSKYAD